MCPEQQEAGPAGGLFVSLFTTDEAAAATSDDAFVRAMLRVEAALARVGAACGVVDAASAADVEAACSNLTPDAVDLGRAARLGGNPVIPLVAALRTAIPERAASALHHGATSQDVLDTAAMLVARGVCEQVQADLGRAVEGAASLAAAHRATLQLARTVLQPALPTTFGLRAAGWANALHEAGERLAGIDRRLPLQLGGAAGTLASLGEDGPELRRLLAAELDLTLGPVPWHGDRQVVAELGHALAAVCGACGKIGRDVSLLSMAEVGEVSEPPSEGRGASSTLPQKRNPILSTLLLANAARAPGLSATLLGSLVTELDRAAGAWQAEWLPLVELLQAAAGSASIAAELASGLEVDPGRMGRNLASAGAAVLSERLGTALSAVLGRAEADEMLRRAARAAAAGAVFRDAVRAELSASDRSELARLDPDELLDPTSYLGSADRFVDAVLARLATGREGSAGARPVAKRE